jgi:hypothetical protein
MRFCINIYICACVCVCVCVCVQHQKELLLWTQSASYSHGQILVVFLTMLLHRNRQVTSTVADKFNMCSILLTNSIYNVGLKVLTAVVMNVAIFWDIALFQRTATFLWNVSSHMDYMALYTRWWHHLYIIIATFTESPTIFWIHLSKNYRKVTFIVE